jgi:hypothetical protein
MIRRPEPFQGKTGLYEPADSMGLNSLETRLVVEESVRDFQSEAEMKAALLEGSDLMDWVYTEDGLIVGFGRTPSRNQIDVDVCSFCCRVGNQRGLRAHGPTKFD